MAKADDDDRGPGSDADTASPDGGDAAQTEKPKGKGGLIGMIVSLVIVTLLGGGLGAGLGYMLAGSVEQMVIEKQKVIDLGSMGSFTLPLASSTVNETDSIVRVQDGNIVAIGGLMKQEQSASASGLPGSTTSTMGMLFGTRDKYLLKRELVILIKPTIIRNDSSWKDDLVETQNRLQALDPRLMQLPPAAP